MRDEEPRRRRFGGVLRVGVLPPNDGVPARLPIGGVAARLPIGGVPARLAVDGVPAR